MARLKDESTKPSTPKNRRFIKEALALLPLAVDVGLAYELMVSDAVYVSLAKIHETTLVTADKKLVEIAGKTDSKRYVAWLADYAG